MGRDEGDCTTAKRLRLAQAVDLIAAACGSRVVTGQILREAIMAGKIHCYGLERGRRRPEDPGVESRAFWRRESRLTFLEIVWDESRARRQVRDPRRPSVSLSNYEAYAIEVDYAELVAAFPAVAQAEAAKAQAAEADAARAEAAAVEAAEWRRAERKLLEAEDARVETVVTEAVAETIRKAEAAKARAEAEAEAAKAAAEPVVEVTPEDEAKAEVETEAEVSGVEIEKTEPAKAARRLKGSVKQIAAVEAIRSAYKEKYPDCMTGEVARLPESITTSAVKQKLKAEGQTFYRDTLNRAMGRRDDAK
jgi:hypothetical protein